MQLASIDAHAARRTATNVLLLLAFAGYVLVVLLGALVHEPWWDEAQAWLIARDAPLPELFARDLRYEGHPPLWYLILAVPARLGLPYESLKVAGALAGIAGVFLLLFRCRAVPLAVRLLLPFSFYFAYQYTVVARSYVLFGPLLIGLALLYERRGEHFGAYVALLILLANVSVHGSTMSCALAALLAFDLLRGRIVVPAKRLAIGIAVFAANLIMLAVVLWPPPDNTSYVSHHSVVDPRRYAEVLREIFPQLFWGTGVSAGVIAAIGMIVLLIWFGSRGTLPLYLLTTAAALFVSARYYSLWHEGIFFFVILFVAVIGFGRASGSMRWLDWLAQAVLIVVLVRHVQWTASSLNYDMHYEFTGSARAAEFIRDQHLDRLRVAGTGVRVVELQPYFDKKLFINYPGTFWDWSPRNDWPYAGGSGFTRATVTSFYGRLLAAHPDVIVTSIGFGKDSLYDMALRENHEYRLLGAFPGTRYWKNRHTALMLFRIYARR